MFELSFLIFTKGICYHEIAQFLLFLNQLLFAYCIVGFYFDDIATR
jgi:hypothetical protein